MKRRLSLKINLIEKKSYDKIETTLTSVETTVAPEYTTEEKTWSSFTYETITSDTTTIETTERPSDQGCPSSSSSGGIRGGKMAAFLGNFVRGDQGGDFSKNC